MRLKYKGYIGKIFFSKEDNLYYGQIINTRDLILFEVTDRTKVKKHFKQVVNDYLEFLEEVRQVAK